MGWQDLLVKADETFTFPWTGGRELRTNGRVLTCKGRLPAEQGWHQFSITSPREARWKAVADVQPQTFFEGAKLLKGYLVGDRVILDSANGSVLDPLRIMEQTETAWLIEPGLERFARVSVSRMTDGRLIYVGQEFPLGPEQEVTEAFQDRKDSVAHIPHVIPALDLAFRFERWARVEGERLRAEAERLAREEAARVALAERRAGLARALGTGEGRRAMALVDFEAAARAALLVGGAELLDWHNSRTAGEAVVQFRLQNRRFECVAQKETLRIIDAGICLVDHRTQERGDTRFTLESLPGVIAQAMREGVLHVFRHVGGGYDDDNDDD